MPCIQPLTYCTCPGMAMAHDRMATLAPLPRPVPRTPRGMALIAAWLALAL